VCGRIRAFKTGDPDDFIPYGVREQNPTIAGNYVDGVSLTHGRSHTWSSLSTYLDLCCMSLWLHL
jgi:hypothetical protein